MTLISERSPDGAQLNASLLALDTQVDEPVQMKLLAWVMGLPSGLDPAMAAQLVITHQAAQQTANHISTALMRLVEVVAQYPHERLTQMAGARRRSLMN
jgi:hypothetical protein